MKKLIGTLLLAASLSVASLANAIAQEVDVTFIVVSDIDKMADKKSKRGGFARVNALIKAERAKGGNVVYALAGDFLSPSLMSGFDKGEHIVELINIAPPDIIAPGNHEFDFGKETFLKRILELNSTILSANLRRADGSKVPGIEDTNMMTYGDASDPMKSIKVGIVGLTLGDTPELSSPGDLTFAPVIDTAMSNAKALREAGADIVVAVLHEGLSVDLELYQSRAFDFVLSGHDHDLTVLYNGRAVLAESRSQGEMIVAVDVKFTIGERRGRRQVRWWPNFRIIDSATLTPDPETLTRVQNYQADLSKELDVAIGTTSTEIDTRRPSVRSGEAVIGNIIADAMRSAVGADIGLTNGGGIRGDKVYDAGTEILRRDILTELPFGNKTVLLEVDGATVKSALENGVSRVEDVAGRFPHVSGLTFTFDPAKPSGERVSNVMVGDAPLDMAKSYTLATNDFMAGGGDGYAMLRGAKVLIDALAAKLMANDVMVYIREQGTIAPKIEGRIKQM